MIYDVGDTGRVWSDLRRKEDDLKWGGHTPGFGRHADSMGRPASTSSNFGFAWGHEQMGRVSRVRRALDESGPMSQRMIAQSLSHIDLSTIWYILVSACQDIALYYGGSVLAGGFIGGAGGALLAGVGAVPGAALGAAAGGQVGGFVLTVLGLESFVEGVAHAIPEALDCYAKGFVEAWGPTRQDRHQSFGGGARGDPSSGAFHLAQGHVVLIGIILALLATYVMSGRADLMNKIGLSPRLGPKVARWVEENKDKLRQYLASRTRGRGALANEKLPPPKPKREPMREQERDTSGESERNSKTAQEANAENGANAPAVGDGLAFRADLQKHMIGPDGFTKSGQLSGTHNLDNATAALNSRGATYTVNTTNTPGISELQYTYTNPATGKLVSGNKTVYDPVVLSDNMMMDNAQQAGQTAWTQHLQNPSVKVFDGMQGGVNFRSYINIDKSGNAFIGNVHPIK